MKRSLSLSCRARGVAQGFQRSAPTVGSRSTVSAPTFLVPDPSPGFSALPLTSAAPTLRTGNPSWKVLAVSSLRQMSFFTGNNNVAATSDSEEDAVARVEAWLDNLFSQSPERATTEHFLAVLRMLAASKLPDAAVRSDRWLHRLEMHAGVVSADTVDTNGQAMPNAECYQCVIEAWASAVSEDPARVVTRAERWLWKHIASPSESLRPNTACFNAFLDACTKGRSFRGSKNTNLQQQHAQKAEEVLLYMIDRAKHEGPQCRMAPNTESFNFVLRGWTRDRRNYSITECTSRVFNMLEQYQSTIDSRVRPNSLTFRMLMDSIAVRAKLKVKRCRPTSSARDEVDYNGLEEIHLLKNMLEFLHSKQMEGNTELAPSTFCYNMLLACWANIAPLHYSAPSEAEAVLRQMTSLKDQGHVDLGPDSTSYMLVLRAWVDSDRPNRGERVEWLLSKQWNDFDFSGDDNLRPTVDAYNLVIRVWASLKEPFRAEKVLTELINLSDDEKSGALRPNSESFSNIIRAWLAVANNGSEKALQRAADWLNTLVKREKVDPDLVTAVDLYSSILGAARKCASHAPEVLDLSVDVFDQLRASHHMMEPLHFSRLIQIGLLALSKPEKTEVRNILREACRRRMQGGRTDQQSDGSSSRKRPNILRWMDHRS